MTLASLVKETAYTLLQGSLDTEVAMLANDSRKVGEKALFFCIPGSVSDGHDYAGEVAAKGASVLVVEHPVSLEDSQITILQVESSRLAMGLISAAFYGNPSRELTVIGITGTKGKTTTTYMIQSMLNESGHKCGLIGTIELIVGEEHIPASHTTPESLVIHQKMREMIEAGMDSVVMEVSSQGLMLDRVAGVEFDYGIFTNLSEDHIGPNEHGSFEEYMMWKKRLFSLCRIGFFNLDDIYAKQMMEGSTCEKITYGLTAGADYYASDIHLYSRQGALGVAYSLCHEGSSHQLEVNMPGDFSVHNSLAAICVARAMGVSMDIVSEVLKRITVKGRVELIPISDAFTVLIDYAHNAVSLESILDCMRAYNPKRLIAVFGCGGNRSRVRRYEMGEVSGNKADFTIITSDNPRFEEPLDIINDIKAGISKTSGRYIEIPDRKEAFRYAIMNAREGDVIVFAGKGHEDYQEIKGVKYHMDERELIREVLEEENIEEICGYHNRYFS